MPGIRLHHAAFQSCTYVVELPQVYPQPYQCPACGKQHDRKAIHLRLDADGDVIVSQPIYEQLLQVFLGGMELANEVEKPPPLALGAVDTPTTQIIELPLNRDTKAADFYVPGQTKYQGRDKVEAGFKRLLTKADAKKLKRKENGQH
jgi:hypothetical protein